MKYKTWLSWFFVGIVLFTTHSYAATCDSCDSCEAAVSASLPGEVIELTQSILYSEPDNIDGCIDLSNANNNVVFDCQNNAITSSHLYSVQAFLLNSVSPSVTIRNCEISGFRTGINNFNSNNNVFFNIFAHGNLDGIEIRGGSGNVVQNSVLENNVFEDFDLNMNSVPVSSCNNDLVNVVGTGGKEIALYHSPVNLVNREYSKLILCNADNSNLENISYHINNSFERNELSIYYTDNSNFKNLFMVHTGGISLINSNNNVFRDIFSFESGHYGLSLFDSSDNDFSNLQVRRTHQIGMYLSGTSSNNFFNNSWWSTNTGMAFFLTGGGSNTIANSLVLANPNSGIHVDSSSNLLYNNVIKNANNDGGVFGTNTFSQNIDCTKTNILGGSCVGGNYWSSYASPTAYCIGDSFGELGDCIDGLFFPHAPGFSDTCSDSNSDGFCDSVFVIGTGTDYFPLAKSIVVNTYDLIVSDNSSGSNVDGDVIMISAVYLVNDLFIPDATCLVSFNGGIYQTMLESLTDYRFINSFQEGVYNYNVICSKLNHDTLTASGSFSINPLPDNPPSVNLISPLNGAVIDSNVSFVCDSNDDFGVSSMSLLTNVSGVWKTDFSVNNNFLSYDWNYLDNGSYVWACEACDTSNQCSLSPTRTFIVENVVIPQLPLPTSMVLFDDSSINTLPSDLVEISAVYSSNSVFVSGASCMISINNVASVAMVESSNSYNFVSSYFPGLINYFVNCSKQGYDSAVSSGSFVVGYPELIIFSNFREINDSSVELNCSSTSNDVTIYHNTSGFWSEYSGSNLVSLVINNLLEGSYSWYCAACDAYSCDSTSNESFIISYDRIILDWTQWDSNTTNFSIYTDTELESLPDVTFSNSFGKIRYLENLNLSVKRDLTNLIKIWQNHVLVDSVSLPEFNKRSNISFRNVNFNVPRLLRDGVVCGSYCSNESYIGSEFSFTSSGFSSYELVEAQCIDGVQNFDELGVDCGGSLCVACPIPPPTGTSGGSSGGSSKVGSSSSSRTSFNQVFNDVIVMSIFTKTTESTSGELVLSSVINKLPIPTSLVYDYFYLDSSFERDIFDEAFIDFKVNKSWIESNGLSPENIFLNVYTSSWKELETSNLSSDSNFVFFQAKTNDLGNFVVTGEKVYEQLIPSDEIETVEDVGVKTAPIITGAVTGSTKPSVSYFWLILILVILIFVSSSYFALHLLSIKHKKSLKKNEK